MTRIVEWNGKEEKEKINLPVFKSFLLGNLKWVETNYYANNWDYLSEHPSYPGLWYAWDEGDYNNGGFFSTKQLWKK